VTGRLYIAALAVVIAGSIGIGKATAGRLPPPPGVPVTSDAVVGVLPLDTGTTSVTVIEGSTGTPTFQIGDDNDNVSIGANRFRLLSSEIRYGGELGVSVGYTNYLNDDVRLFGEGYGLQLDDGANEVTTDEAAGASSSMYVFDTDNSQNADGYLVTWEDANTARMRITNEGSVQFVDGGHSGIGTTPSLPTCDSGESGVLAPYDDTDDATAGTVCYCGTDGAGGWAWVSLTGGTCP